jgi:hypothetical protein
MSHHVSKPQDITIPSSSLWAKLPIIGLIAAVVGIGATLAMAGGSGRERAMFSYLWAYEAMLAIALGCLGLVLIAHITRSGWEAVLRRVPETAAATLPLFALLWIPIGTWGMHALYPWSHEVDEILAKKRWFLNEGFFYGRTVAYFVIWAALSYFFYSRSVAQDKLGDLNASNTPTRDRITRSMWLVAGPGLLLWCFSLSFAAIDWMMSLQPHWYSTIWGVYYFAGALLTSYSFITLVTMALQKAGVLKEAVTTEHFHDLGKLVFGYTIFWTYIAFSQFILIWYANIPEETIFYLTRLDGGWKNISYALPIIHFGVPFFFFISRQVKRNRFWMGFGAVWMVLMELVDMYWLILPNWGTHGETAKEAVFAPNLSDLTAIIGIGGAFLAVFSYLLVRNKVVGINDPRLEESLAHENY